MQRQIVFIPVGSAELGAFDGSPAILNRRAYTVTPDLLTELGYEPSATEDAEYAALVLASVAGLAEFGERTVIVAEVTADLIAPGEDSANGECLLLSCPTAAMTSWFCDAPGVDVTAAARAAKGCSIDQAWEIAEVQELLNAHDLLWNDVAEYRRGLIPG
ncbi:MAG TPA: hypothetical protein PKE40_15175 [Arachnia sp.]|nr:hypothetical protein [Arachnia sp.]HMT87683.1 hypothetical protein [Arachnia sp.]